MTKIIAKGMRDGVPVEITCEKAAKGLIVVSDSSDLEQLFRSELEKRHPVAGTFYPEVESLTNALEVLRYHFFDGEPEIKIKGAFRERIPFKSDVIF